MHTDILIIGAGTRRHFHRPGADRARGAASSILLVEKGAGHGGAPLPQSPDPGRCVDCKPYCHITTGFSGAGAFSDGKLSLSYRGGRRLAPALVGRSMLAQDPHCTTPIPSTWSSAPTSTWRASRRTEAVKEIRKRAIQAGLKLVDCPIRHLGTEKAQDIYTAIERYLLAHGVEICFGMCVHRYCSCRMAGALGVLLTDGKTEQEVYAAHTVVAAGRRGADWLDKLCARPRHGPSAAAPWTSASGWRCATR